MLRVLRARGVFQRLDGIKIPCFGITSRSKPFEKVVTDTVSERLRRWTRNPLGSARRGSNPLGVDRCLHTCLVERHAQHTRDQRARRNRRRGAIRTGLMRLGPAGTHIHTQTPLGCSTSEEQGRRTKPAQLNASNEPHG